MLISVFWQESLPAISKRECSVLKPHTAHCSSYCSPCNRGRRKALHTTIVKLFSRARKRFIWFIICFFNKLHLQIMLAFHIVLFIPNSQSTLGQRSGSFYKKQTWSEATSLMSLSKTAQSPALLTAPHRNKGLERSSCVIKSSFLLFKSISYNNLMQDSLRLMISYISFYK